MPAAVENSISRLGALFLIVNLLVFPAASLLFLPGMYRLLDPLTTPLWILAGLPVFLGLALIGCNAALAVAAWRRAGWTGEAAAMAVWTALSVLTFALLGGYSPFTLFLRRGLDALAGW